MVRNPEQIWSAVKADMDQTHLPFAGAFIEELPLQTQNLLRVAAVTGYRLATLEAAIEDAERASG